MAQVIDIRDLLEWAFRDQRVETQQIPDEDALTVYWAVMALPEPHASLVRVAARSGRPPDWRTPAGDIIVLSEVRDRRLAWRGWVRAMIVLRRTLSEALHRFSVQGPMVAEEPWLAGRGVPPPASGRSARLR